MTREDRNALITGQRCAQAITAVVNDVPTGCPERRLYASLSDPAIITVIGASAVGT